MLPPHLQARRRAHSDLVAMQEHLRDAHLATWSENAWRQALEHSSRMVTLDGTERRLLPTDPWPKEWSSRYRRITWALPDGTPWLQAEPAAAHAGEG